MDIYKWGEFSDKISKNNITQQFIAKTKFKFEIFELQKHSAFLSKQITATKSTKRKQPCCAKCKPISKT